MPTHLYESYQWKPGRHGLYESNYLKANSPDGKLAVWIKHNILAPADPKSQAIVELWCVLFRRGKRPLAVKQERPISEVTLANDCVRMKGDWILLSPQRTATTIVDGSNQVSWDISMTPEPESVGEPMIHFPYAGMYNWKFPKKKILTPAPRSRWHGSLQFGDQIIEIRDWIGFRNHNWGTEHAARYAYGNCNYFPDAPHILFDGFSAKIRLGLFLSPFISMGILRNGAQDIPFNSPCYALLSKVKLEFPTWEAVFKHRKYTLYLTQTGDPIEFIGLPYHNPDGRLSYCYNTKWAQTTLVLRESNGSEQRFSSPFGELEFLLPEPIPNVSLYPNHMTSSSGSFYSTPPVSNAPDPNSNHDLSDLASNAAHEREQRTGTPGLRSPAREREQRTGTPGLRSPAREREQRTGSNPGLHSPAREREQRTGLQPSLRSPVHEREHRTGSNPGLRSPAREREQRTGLQPSLNSENIKTKLDKSQ
jgi:hypothetical protein